jgi:NAD+ kinase
MPVVKPTAPQIRSVLLARKTTGWERYQQLELGAGEDTVSSEASTVAPEVLARLEHAHDEHTASFEQVRSALQDAGLEVNEVRWPTLEDTRKADLVVTVGGDGTFLRCAMHVSDVPMVGVNSSPTYSVGHYCGLVADDVTGFLASLRAGHEEVTWLPRIQGIVGTTPLPHLALNDMLFCQRCPAASSRYTITLGDDVERHISSGVWVATPSGSTSAIRSAGGDVQSHGDAGLQYLVREAYAGLGGAPEMTGGTCQESLVLTPMSPDLMVFLDGHHQSFNVPLATPLVLKRVERSLPVYRYTLR